MTRLSFRLVVILYLFASLDSSIGFGLARVAEHISTSWKREFKKKKKIMLRKD